MRSTILISLFIVLAFAHFIYSQDRIVSVSIFDQHPTKNSDFEPELGSLKTGLVKTKLPTSRVPELGASTNDLKTGRINNPELFPTWFNRDTTKNVQIPFDIPFKKVLDSETNTYIYQYKNNAFFPIDKQGWDVSSTYRSYTDDDGKYHNYHFCLKMNYKFSYKGYETFYFTGDDDVWVYINNTLAVDLGGLHSKESASIDLSTQASKTKLGITPDNTYNFDFFYCERHTTASNMEITTNFDLFCPKFDYCGTCLGNGCCKPDADCNDNNPCTVDICPDANDPTVTASNWKSKCTHEPKVCTSNSQCLIPSCQAGTGKCITTPLPPKDRSSECLFASSCSDKTGWNYGNACNQTCQTGACNADGTCAVTTDQDCATQLGLGPCYTYSCDKNGSGCVATPLCKQSTTNPCLINECKIVNDQATCVQTTLAPEKCNCDCTGQLDSCLLKRCDVTDGSCAPIKIDGIDDGNLCTVDSCDKNTGKITHEPIVCVGCTECVKGKCEPSDALCEDNNICTTSKCGANNTCVATPISCDDNNPCTVDTCDQFKGCIHTPITCADEGSCSVGYCDTADGVCKTKPRQCTPENPAFCLIYECDENAGCISYDKPCVAENSRCKQGYCDNSTMECKTKDYDPQPFICKTAAVVSTAVIAGVTVAGAVALGLAIFGGKKGYDYWKESRGANFSSSNSNPLYVQNPNGGENPLYAGASE
ncbi:hypothetical protein CYY_006414 [Polysphondylium violaceum]|uniref:PA14 domain-containing protein n=1 Tax=Polysphondylium violaceum TaxID=133409 RepID=A0A8J4PSP5_9MYCE|nr:hypothetical protein CYY_006414 [Polysphondylium violaceum]